MWQQYVHYPKKRSLLSDKKMETQGRGTHQERVTILDYVGIRITKWYDNKDVHLISTYARANPTKEVQRWDMKSKEIIHIKCPNIVFQYNAYMAGVDLLDSFIYLYRIKIRSRKWYHRMVFHFVAW